MVYSDLRVATFLGAFPDPVLAQDTDPNLRLGITRADQEVVLNWFDSNAVVYQVESSANFAAWTNSSLLITGKGALLFVTNSIAEQSERFYRVKQLPPPQVISANFDPSTGVLAIVGDNLNNVIVVSRTATGTLLVNGATDTLIVNDLTGTDLANVFAHLAGTIGGTTGDAAADNVIVNGRAGDDAVIVSGTGNEVNVAGSFALVTVTHGEVGIDRLTINLLAGDDVLDASALSAGIIRLVADGGDDDDVLTGSDGADTLLGGEGDDVLIGGPGVEVLDGGPGNNIVIQ